MGIAKGGPNPASLFPDDFSKVVNLEKVNAATREVQFCSLQPTNSHGYRIVMPTARSQDRRKPNCDTSKITVVTLLGYSIPVLNEA